MSRQVADRMLEVARLLKAQAYTPAATECLQLLEVSLRDLIARNLMKLPGDERLRFIDVEREMGGGKKTFDSFNLGQLVGLVRRSHFLEAWSRATGTDVAAIGMINLDALNTLRNKIVHDQRPATSAEAQLLFNVLRNVLDTFGVMSVDVPSPARRRLRGDAAPRAVGEPTEGRPSRSVVLAPLSIAAAPDVAAWGWDGAKLLHRLIEIDYATIDGLNEGNEGRIDQWAPVFMDHPDTWRLLVAGPEQVVGYWHFVPLFGDDFEAAKAGALLDGDITTDRVCYLELPGHFGIYFVSIATLQQYRGVASFRLLMDALVNQMIQLARHGVFFEEICANAFSPQGQALCRTLEMNFLCQHQDFGKIYSRRLSPFPARGIFGQHPELARLYSGST